MARSFAKGIVDLLWGSMDEPEPVYESRKMGGSARPVAEPEPEPEPLDDRPAPKQSFWRPRPQGRLSEGPSEVVELRANSRPTTEIHYPRSFDDSQALADQFKKGSLLIVDLEQVEEKERSGLVKFLCGVAYGCDGQSHRINELTFTFAPRVFSLEAETPKRDHRGSDYSVPRFRANE